MIKVFLAKCTAIVLFIGLLIVSAYYFDTFNVFHWQNIRFTTAEPNKNFVKTTYILQNPQKFNAFIFGSSRVGNIPEVNLPKTLGQTKLHWYNMTHSEGIPAEHFLTLKTFLENGVHIDMVLLGFDNIPMYASLEQHKMQLLRIPYQVYQENKSSFYRPYLQKIPAFSIIKAILFYNASAHTEETDLFYQYGTEKHSTDFSLTENPQMERYVSAHNSSGYTQKDAYKDIIAVSQLCKEHDIPLVLFTNPIYETTYRAAIHDGYLDFLCTVAEQCEFYHFSSLNIYTQDPHYYFESSHYRPVLGLLVEKLLFGTEEERDKIRADADDALWGIKVNAENVDVVISELKKQIAEE